MADAFAGIVGIAGHVTLALVFRRQNLVSRGSGTLHVALAVANAGVVAGFPFTAVSALAGRSFNNCPYHTISNENLRIKGTKRFSRSK